MSHDTMSEIKVDKSVKSWMDPFRDLGVNLTNWSIRYIPDAWIIAVFLSVVVFLMALVWGETDVLGAVNAWGKGFWALLTLMAQFMFSIVVAYACAASPIVGRILNYMASRPNPDKPWQAVLLIVVFAVVTAWFNWAVTIIVSAMLVPYLARHNPKTDFRLLVASAYAGAATMWHSGLSGTAPLLVATPENFLLKAGIISELIPVERTIFSPFNWTLVIISAVIVVAVFTVLTPRPEKAYTLSKEEAEELIVVLHEPRPEKMTFAQLMAWWPGWNLMCGIAGVTYMILKFKESGSAAWTIDMYNMTFLICALFLTWRPVVFLNACKNGIAGTWGILVQFPFYGGIFGLVSFTNLGHFLTGLFTSFCTRETYLPIIYWYSGLLSYFVPSGGSKFAIEAPYILPAAKSFGISQASATLVYGWGDMLTHLIQPFWAIPVLGITKTSFGEIAGFCGLLFVIYAFILTIAMFFAPLAL